MYVLIPFAVWASIVLNLFLWAEYLSSKHRLPSRTDKNLALIATAAFAVLGVVTLALAQGSIGRYSSQPTSLHMNLAVGAFVLGIFGSAALTKAGLKGRPTARRYRLGQFATPPTRIQAASLALTGGLLAAWALVQLVPQIVALGAHFQSFYIRA